MDSRNQRYDSRTGNRTTNRMTVNASDDRDTRASRTTMNASGDRSSLTSRTQSRSTQPRETRTRDTRTRTSTRTSGQSSAPRARRSTSRSDSQTGWSSRSERNVYTPANQTVWQRIMGVLPDNVWVNRIILIVAALLVVFILFNLVTCIGHALAPKSETPQASESAASADPC